MFDSFDSVIIFGSNTEIQVKLYPVTIVLTKLPVTPLTSETATPVVTIKFPFGSFQFPLIPVTPFNVSVSTPVES